jgi:cytochrome b subunit of formate dehydrogenase
MPSILTPDLMRAELTPTEARQGTGPRAMFWVLIISLTLAVIAGLLLWLGWIALP